MQTDLFSEEVLYEALVNKDSHFEGLFFTGVKTTGIFCRATCTARKPKRENVEFFSSIKEALASGYRPCKVCKPLIPAGEYPEYIKALLDQILQNPDVKINDQRLREMELEPVKIRRWFKKNLGMTFQAFQRLIRINTAFDMLQQNGSVTDAAFSNGYNSLSGFQDAFKSATGVSPKNGKDIKKITITRLSSPLGPLLAGASDKGICLLEFTDRRMLETQLDRLRQYLKALLLPGKDPLLDRLQEQMDEYFSGERKVFDLPLDVPGSPFQTKVWDALMQIPYGETASYKKQAILMGNPGAVRAVGKANGDNRMAIIIPCHRVIGENGAPVGYGGGVWRKLWLLEHERKNK